MTKPLWPHSDEALKIMAKYVDVPALVRMMGKEQVIEAVGAEQLAQALSPEQVVQALSPKRVVEALGPERVVEALGLERLLDAMLSKMTPEQQRQLRERLPKEEKKTPNAT